jgi:hypothetical protein
MPGDALAAKDAVEPLIHKSYIEEPAQAYAGSANDRCDRLISLPAVALCSGRGIHKAMGGLVCGFRPTRYSGSRDTPGSN